MSEQNVDNNVVEDVVEAVNENVVENVDENVNEVVKEKMPSVKKEETPTITNPEPVVETPKVNKKLSAMSKNTKEKQKNRKLSKPTVSNRANPKGPFLNINPMYLLGIIGVIIGGLSLWYQRKSFLKEQQKDDDNESVSTGGETETKKSPPKKKTAKRQNFDPWEWKREHQQTGVASFPGNYDFD